MYWPKPADDLMLQLRPLVIESVANAVRLINVRYRNLLGAGSWRDVNLFVIYGPSFDLWPIRPRVYLGIGHAALMDS